MLGSAGYLVDSASNGKLGLELMREHPAHLVLTEMAMPEMDGVELIQALHRHYPKTKIVATPGGGIVPPHTYIRLAKSLRVDEVLVKPFTPSELLATVDSLLGIGDGTEEEHGQT